MAARRGAAPRPKAEPSARARSAPRDPSAGSGAGELSERRLGSMRAAWLIVLIGCAHPRAPVPTAPPGRSVSIYMSADAQDPDVKAALQTIRDRTGDPTPTTGLSEDAIGYVDDRRFIELAAGGELELPDVPRSANLDSLVVEPLGEPAGPDALAIVQCTRAPALAASLADPRALVGRTVEARTVGGGTARGTVKSADDGGLWLEDNGRVVRVLGERIESLRVAGSGSGLVRCKVRGAPGKHLVRVAYVTGDVSWHAIHRLDVDVDDSGAGKATVRTGFQIDAPGWTGDAQINLWRGLPGAEDPPERVWTGAAGLGEQVTVWSEPREVPAHLISVYRGALVQPGESETDAYWRQQSDGDVRTWLVLDAQLPIGTALVGVSVKGAPARVIPGILEKGGATTKMAMWIDPDLRGLRIKTYQSGDEHGLREHLAWSVSNLSDHARDVWIEEELRPVRRHRVLNAKPKLDLEDGWLRAKVTVPAGGLARAACDVLYDL